MFIDSNWVGQKSNQGEITSLFASFSIFTMLILYKAHNFDLQLVCREKLLKTDWSLISIFCFIFLTYAFRQLRKCICHLGRSTITALLRMTIAVQWLPLGKSKWLQQTYSISAFISQRTLPISYSFLKLKFNIWLMIYFCFINRLNTSWLHHWIKSSCIFVSPKYFLISMIW